MRKEIDKYLPPCTYQGGKQRLAEQICDFIEEKVPTNFVFYDLCCGSGAVSLEMLHRNHKVVMIDKGPYGYFWESIANGTFDLNIFDEELNKLPKIEDIQSYLKELSLKPIDEKLFVYHYILLQAGSFGGKQIWVKNGKWCNNTFRSYWLPTETSNRRSPVNPMLPMPDTILYRVKKILSIDKEMIEAHPIDIKDSFGIIVDDIREKVVYIDPPYQNTTGYFDKFDIYEIISKFTNVDLFISEGCNLDGFENHILSEGRKKGNISGNVKKNAVVEILNYRLAK